MQVTLFPKDPDLDITGVFCVFVPYFLRKSRNLQLKKKLIASKRAGKI